MTDSQRKGWLGGISVVGVAGVLGLLKFWPEAQPLADWLLFNLGAMWARPQVEVIVLAVLMGPAITLGLPWLLPDWYCGEKTRTRLRLYAGGMSFAVALLLVPTRLGFVYAVLVGLAGTQLGMTAMRLMQRLLPHDSMPPSLKPNDDSP